MRSVVIFRVFFLTGIMTSEEAGGGRFLFCDYFFTQLKGSIWGLAGQHKMTTFYRVAVWGVSFSLWITKQGRPHSAVTRRRAWTPAQPLPRPSLSLCRARVPAGWVLLQAPPRVGTCRHMSAPRVFLELSPCDWWQQRCPFMRVLRWCFKLG